MLFPLVGDAIARLARERPQRAKAWTAAVAGTFAAAVIVLMSHAMTGWVAKASSLINSAPFTENDPILVELFDWTDLRQALEQRHVDPGRTFVAGMRWESCAKSAYALRTSYSVLCLAPQNVHFTYIADPAAFRGQDAMIVDLSLSLKDVQAMLGSDFDGGPTLPRGMRDVRDLRVYRGIRFHGVGPKSMSASP